MRNVSVFVAAAPLHAVGLAVEKTEFYWQWKGMPVMCGPRGLPTGRTQLFHNDGHGKFTDASKASGISKPEGCYGFTVLASDIDNDGYPDLYVACDSRPSLLFHNQKNGTFEEVGVASGVALSDAGQEQAARRGRVRLRRRRIR